jgi:hypothetical protein
VSDGAAFVRPILSTTSTTWRYTLRNILSFIPKTIELGGLLGIDMIRVLDSATDLSEFYHTGIELRPAALSKS